MAGPTTVAAIRSHHSLSSKISPILSESHLDVGMPQLLRDVLNGRMVLIELDSRIAVPQIVDAIDTQACEDTDTPMEFGKSRGRQGPFLMATEDHRRNRRGALENGGIKTMVAQIEQCRPDLLRPIDATAPAILRRVEHPVRQIIGALERQEPVLVLRVLPELDVLPVQPQRFPFAPSSSGDAHIALRGACQRRNLNSPTVTHEPGLSTAYENRGAIFSRVSLSGELPIREWWYDAGLCRSKTHASSISACSVASALTPRRPLHRQRKT